MLRAPDAAIANPSTDGGPGTDRATVRVVKSGAPAASTSDRATMPVSPHRATRRSKRCRDVPLHLVGVRTPLPATGHGWSEVQVRRAQLAPDHNRAVRSRRQYAWQYQVGHGLLGLAHD